MLTTNVLCSFTLPLRNDHLCPMVSDKGGNCVYFLTDGAAKFMLITNKHRGVIMIVDGKGIIDADYLNKIKNYILVDFARISIPGQALYRCLQNYIITLALASPVSLRY